MSHGRALFFVGGAEEATDPFTIARRLGWHESWQFRVAATVAFSVLLDRNCNGAAAWVICGLDDAPSHVRLHTILVVALGQLGRPDGARHHLEQLLAECPALTAEELRGRVWWSGGSDVERYLEGLVNAGFSAAD